MQRSQPIYLLLPLLFTAFFAQLSPAFQEPANQVLPSFDSRKAGPLLLEETRVQVEAATRIKQRVPSVHIDHDKLLGTARFIRAFDGFLSGPHGEGRAISPEVLRQFPAQDPHRTVKAFMKEHASLLGHGPEALDSARLKRDFESAHNGLRTISWEQHYDNIPIYAAIFSAHLTAKGELVNISSQFAPALEKARKVGHPEGVVAGRPFCTVEQAIRVAAANLGEPLNPAVIHPLGEKRNDAERHQTFQAAPLPGTIRAKLTWLPMNASELRLCWQIDLTRRVGNERYRLLIDTETSEVRLLRALTVYLSDATYRVFTSDSPSPFTPSYPVPVTNQPPLTSRALVSLSALSTNASPLGWINDGANETRGNNVDAHLDQDADDLPDLPRPQGSPFRVFDFPIDLNQSPSNYSSAAVVQLFYWCNWMHDQLYDLGFTEAAGNFQKDNFGRGGFGEDPVVADAQDGSGFNNANFTFSEDGESPRLQIFIFNGPIPARDADLDGEVILHEYTHGLSDRLVGGGAGLSSLQSVGMAEGWSDFYALALLSVPTDDVDAVYAYGGYASYLIGGLTQNYYFGIRRYPYSTDLAKNPLTFKDIDPLQADSHSQVPFSPRFHFDPAQANEVHNMGEVWCATLWDARANFIRKHGFAAGNWLMLQVVTDGMKLSPGNPTYIQARDAIIQADLVNNGGANWFELWTAFAKRGLGFSATSPLSLVTTGVHEAFDLPDPLLLTPFTAFIASGPAGGPVLPACSSYTLTNVGGGPLSWSAAADQSWLYVSPASGTVPVNAATVVTVCISTNSSKFTVGNYPASITFTNLTTGVLHTRPAQLQILNFSSTPFVEDFESGGIKPQWLVTGTGPFRTQVTSGQAPHSGSYHLLLDSSELGAPARNELTLGLDLAGYTNVSLRFWVKSFGDESDGPPPRPFIGGADFDGVAISSDGVSWYEALGLRNLSTSWREYALNLDAAAAAAGLNYNSTFRIRFNHFDDNPIPYDGIALDDITITGLPARRFTLSVPSQATEGDGILTNQGRIDIGLPVASPLVVALHSSDLTKASVPATVVIPAGATEAHFDIHIVDNALLDGTQPVTISADAPNYYGEGAAILVADNESATLRLKLPVRAKEGAGLLPVAGRIKVTSKVAREIAVQMRSSDPSRVQVPPTVILPTGANSASFDLFIGDGVMLGEDPTVTITAHVANWRDGVDHIEVLDNDRPGLIVELPAQALESDGLLPGAGRVHLFATVSSNLVVSLVSSNVASVTVPSSITVPAGVLEATFDLNIVDNNLIDGPRTVTLSATARGFGSATASMTILDDETPPAPYQPSPPDLSVNVPLNTSLKWQGGVGEIVVNGGFETGDFTGWQHDDFGYGSFVINDGKLDPPGPDFALPPYAGKFSVLSQQNGGGTHAIYQDLVIPLDTKSVSLTWLDRIRNQASAFSTGAQEFRVEIRDLANKVLATPFTTKPGDPLKSDWTQRSYDLTAYRGQIIRLAFLEMDFLGYMNIHLDNISVVLGSMNVSYDVYFGTNAQPGLAEFQGTSTVPDWSLFPLPMNTTWYWQIVSKSGLAQTRGPVWQFTTRGVGKLDHFEWSSFPAIQYVDQPFGVTIFARDDLNNLVTNYTGTASIQAVTGRDTASAIVITEVDTGNSDRIEFANVSDRLFDLAGWQITAYDGRSWPAPRFTFTVPTNSFCAPGEIFTLTIPGSSAPGAYPAFVAGASVSWNYLVLSNQIAVLLRDSAGQVVDFMCASEAYPSPISNPIAIPFDEWGGNPVGVNTNSGFTYQRVGHVDNNTRDDWVLATNSLTRRNPGLDLAFTPRAPISVTPETTSNFVAGVWQGDMTVHQVVGAVRLRADDGYGSLGSTAPFAVTASNDLALVITGTPDVAILGNDLTYTLMVTNIGPDPALDVTIIDDLPQGVVFVSATPSVGNCTNYEGQVSCALGTLAAGSTATVTLLVTPAQPGIITNIARVTRSDPEPYAANNTAVAVNTINSPQLYVGNTAVTEGNTGTTNALFQVRLNAPCRFPVSVSYATADATATAPADYLPQSGVLTFAPGTLSQDVIVPVNGDTLYETTESFYLNLFSPTNATLLVAQGRCRIIDDEQPPSFFINDVTLGEGPPGTTSNAIFTVRLSQPAGLQLSVNYVTTNQTAVAGKDYVSTSGQLVFAPGETNKAISVPVLGDSVAENNETFQLTLFNAAPAYLGRPFAICTILDNGFSELDHFAWNSIPSLQYAGFPFAVQLTAQDARNNPFPFNGTVSFSAFTELRQVTIGNGTNLWENPLGTYYEDGRTQVIYLRDELGSAGDIRALSLNLAAVPGQVMSNWTLRLKPTSLTNYLVPAWEDTGWTTVYQRDEPVPDVGWATFNFNTPFHYDGTNNLMVDFSFNNSSYSADGQCRATLSSQARSINFRTDSAFGDPLTWTGTKTPPPIPSQLVPNIRLFLENDLRLTPAESGLFTGGVWTGQITILDAASNVTLRALDSSQHLGLSAAFIVEPATDTDGDGLPDSWEQLYFGNLDSGSNDDPDHDGVTNYQEFLAGTDPTQPGSALQVTSAQAKANSITITFPTLPGRLYRLERATNLQNPDWIPVGPDTLGNGSLQQFNDFSRTNSSAFYRIRLLP